MCVCVVELGTELALLALFVGGFGLGLLGFGFVDGFVSPWGRPFVAVGAAALAIAPGGGGGGAYEPARGGTPGGAFGCVVVEFWFACVCAPFCCCVVVVVVAGCGGGLANAPDAPPKPKLKLKPPALCCVCEEAATAEVSVGEFHAA